MRIQAVKSCNARGVVMNPGDELEVERAVGSILIARGLAVTLQDKKTKAKDETPEKETVPARKRRGRSR